MLKHIVEDNLVRTQEMMLTNLALWRDKTPEESGVRPRVAILLWVFNDWWPGSTPLDLDTNAE